MISRSQPHACKLQVWLRMTLRLWPHCCAKRIRNLRHVVPAFVERNTLIAAIGLITDWAAHANHDLRLGYEPIIRVTRSCFRKSFTITQRDGKLCSLPWVSRLVRPIVRRVQLSFISKIYFLLSVGLFLHINWCWSVFLCTEPASARRWWQLRNFRLHCKKKSISVSLCAKTYRPQHSPADPV